MNTEPQRNQIMSTHVSSEFVAISNSDLGFVTGCYGGSLGNSPYKGIKPGPGIQLPDFSKIDWGHAADNGNRWGTGGLLAGGGIGATVGLIAGSPTGPGALATGAAGAAVGAGIGGALGWAGGFAGDVIQQLNHH